ncbi:MAG: site-2 protease family protein [Candidatus Pacebacteria bacterium]|nr:site-2 protease family protein [Candidatus Paceibacterota bacterium]
MFTLLIFLIVIIFLVVAHELGHFFAAKFFGIRVDEFGIGYPPRAKKLFTWRGTLFSLNWLPFGGFVKIFGEDPEAATTPKTDSFAAQKMWKRALVIVAGILANMLVAVVLYSISFGVGFLASPDQFPKGTVVGDSQMLITATLPDGPAQAAGIKGGDIIKKITAGDDIIVPVQSGDIVTFIQNNSDEEITFSILRGREVTDISVTPNPTVADGKPGVGVSLTELATVRLPFFASIEQGFRYTGDQFMEVVKGIGRLITGAFRGEGNVMSQVSGPVGIALFANQAYGLGFGFFLSFVALISINLAVINLLPFPALDGGRLIIELFTVKGKSKISPRAVMAINQMGFILLIILMIFVTYNDIVRIFA